MKKNKNGLFQIKRFSFLFQSSMAGVLTPPPPCVRHWIQVIPGRRRIDILTGQSDKELLTVGLLHQCEDSDPEQPRYSCERRAHLYHLTQEFSFYVESSVCPLCWLFDFSTLSLYYSPELESRPKSSRPRRDFDTTRPRLEAKSQDETETSASRDRDETFEVRGSQKVVNTLTVNTWHFLWEAITAVLQKRRKNCYTVPHDGERKTRYILVCWWYF